MSKSDDYGLYWEVLEHNYYRADVGYRGYEVWICPRKNGYQAELTGPYLPEDIILTPCVRKPETAMAMAEAYVTTQHEQRIALAIIEQKISL